MAGGNTIGRVLGQSPPSEGEPESSNPLAELFETLKTVKELADHIKELVETFKPEAPHEASEAHGAGAGSTDPLEELAERLVQLGERLAPAPAEMEGSPRPDQRAAHEVTRALLELVRSLAGEPGSAVDRAAIDAAASQAEEILQRAPSPAHARQAIDNALTAARMEGHAKPAVEVLEKVKKTFEAVKGIIESAKKLLGEARQGDGAFVRDTE